MTVLVSRSWSRNGGSNMSSRNLFFLILIAFSGICYLAKNIGWMISIDKDIFYKMENQKGSIYPQKSSSWLVDGVSNSEHRGASAFCLLIKDDNDILSEWVAYHYHVFRMRRLIVAVDPDSKTSPLDVLESWGQNFDLKFTIWNDEDFTPEYFHSPERRDDSKFPNSVAQSVQLVSESTKKNADQLNDPIRKTDWHPNVTYVQQNQEQVRKAVHKINDHRFRQKKFVGECFRQIRKEQPATASWFGSTSNAVQWVVHIDTDEYLVPNPWIASYIHNEHKNDDRRKELIEIFPNTPSPDSLWSLFQGFLGKNFGRRSCVMMPRATFGSKEDKDDSSQTTTIKSNSTTFTWNHNKFESLRWKYHRNFQSKERPKSIVNVGVLADDESIFTTGLVASIHRPLRKKLRKRKPGCPVEPLAIDNSRNQFKEPLAVYHYLGSMERYFSRPDDRRNRKTYEGKNQQAQHAKGDENSKVANPRWWLGGWLDSFVQVHGGEKTYAVLGEAYGRKD